MLTFLPHITLFPIAMSCLPSALTICDSYITWGIYHFTMTSPHHVIIWHLMPNAIALWVIMTLFYLVHLYHHITLFLDSLRHPITSMLHYLAHLPFIYTSLLACCLTFTSPHHVMPSTIESSHHVCHIALKFVSITTLYRLTFLIMRPPFSHKMMLGWFTSVPFDPRYCYLSTSLHILWRTRFSILIVDYSMRISWRDIPPFRELMDYFIDILPSWRIILLFSWRWMIILFFVGIILPDLLRFMSFLLLFYLWEEKTTCICRWYLWSRGLLYMVLAPSIHPWYSHIVLRGLSYYKSWILFIHFHSWITRDLWEILVKNIYLVLLVLSWWMFPWIDLDSSLG